MTPKQQAAMRQALEALEIMKSYGNNFEYRRNERNPYGLVCDALESLREALAEPAHEPVAWATEIIDALQAQYDTEMIKEHDSGDALIRLDDAIAAVEDAEKHYTAPPQRPAEPVHDNVPHPDMAFDDEEKPQ